jgi:hypothetical protein
MRWCSGAAVQDECERGPARAVCGHHRARPVVAIKPRSDARFLGSWSASERIDSRSEHGGSADWVPVAAEDRGEPALEVHGLCGRPFIGVVAGAKRRVVRRDPVAAHRDEAAEVAIRKADGSDFAGRSSRQTTALNPMPW